MRAGRRGGHPAYICAFSALGSVPAHLVPLLILILESSQGATIIEASLVASALLSGSFAGIVVFAGTSLKLAGTRMISCVVIAQMAVLGLSLLVPQVWMPYLWFVLGFGAGTMVQAGSRLIAGAVQSGQLYLLRVAFSLVFSGGIGLVFVIGGAEHYSFFVYSYLLMLAVFLISSSISRQEPMAPDAVGGSAPHIDGRVFDILGLGVLFVLIVGQIGFLSHIAKNLVGADVSVGQFALYLGLAKLLSGALCWLLYRRNFGGSDRKAFIAAAALIATTATLSTGMAGIGFVGLFFAYDVALCVFCSGVMGRVAARGDGRTGSMVMVSFALGNALAPIAGGWIVIRFGPEFLGIGAIGSTIVAAAWLWATVVRVQFEKSLPALGQKN